MMLESLPRCISKSLPAFLWFIPVMLASNGYCSFTNATANSTTPSYDYIVVGSGPGGGPLASRLAIAGFKVLLIDAGSDQGLTDEEKVPTLWPLSTQYPPMQWNYFINHFPNSTRQQEDSKFTWQTPSGDYVIGQNPPTGSQPLGILYPRAGTLGGCSAHNAMITIYPHDSDWDYIAKLTGDTSWEPRKMRKYFKLLERNEYLPGHPSGHGTDGWLGTSVLDPSILVQDEKVTCHAAAAHGVISNRPVGATPQTANDLRRITKSDPNAPGNTDKEGLYQMILATTNGTRNGPRDFILNTARTVNRDGSRKYHLDILLNTFVTKITFDLSGATPWATGIEYLTGSGLYGATAASQWGTSTGSGSFTATREVIISAGAYNTPQLLKLSGIGPKSELEQLNISVVVDLPGVGTNLQDRYETAVVSKTTTSSEILTGCSLLTANPDVCLEKWQNGTTPAAKGFYAGNAFPLAIIKKTSVAEDNPDVFVFGGPVVFTGYYPGWANVSSLLPSSAEGWWSWVVLKAHVRDTAGTVTLRSTNPLDTPIINYNSFDAGTTTTGADQLDLQAFYEGVQFARQINSELKCSDAFEEVFPGPNVTSEADTKNFIMQEAFGHHASCTAAIGKSGDPNAVLDSSFRVRGVDGLRVVDASVFPKTPGFFPAVPLYMISEKAADVIIQDASTISS